MCRIIRTDIDIKKIEIETKIEIENLIENVGKNINK